MVGKALHHVSLNATDVRACVAFYEAMGFREIEPVSYTHLTLPTKA